MDYHARMTLMSRMFSNSRGPFSGGRVTPFDNPRERFLAGKLGMVFFLVALGALFGATLTGFFVIRFERAAEWPTDLPSLPWLLWVSTAVLIGSSVTMQRAFEENRAERGESARQLLAITFGLGMVFLVLQFACWLIWREPVLERWDGSETQRFALMGFYVLTSLHAAHVIGGIIPLGLMTLKRFRNPRTMDSPRDANLGSSGGTGGKGFWYAAVYWHFLGCVWIVLFLVMLTGM